MSLIFEFQYLLPLLLSMVTHPTKSISVSASFSVAMQLAAQLNPVALYETQHWVVQFELEFTFQSRVGFTNRPVGKEGTETPCTTSKILIPVDVLMRNAGLYERRVPVTVLDVCPSLTYNVISFPMQSFKSEYLEARLFWKFCSSISTLPVLLVGVNVTVSGRMVDATSVKSTEDLPALNLNVLTSLTTPKLLLQMVRAREFSERTWDMGCVAARASRRGRRIEVSVFMIIG